MESQKEATNQQGGYMKQNQMTDRSKYELMTELFTKFKKGTKWLNDRIADGTLKEDDKKEFAKKVIEPMDSLYESFNEEEKAEWLGILKVANIFNYSDIRFMQGE